MKLNGLRIINTRPLGQGQPLNQAIIAAGGIAIHFPALSIEPTDNHWLKKITPFPEIDQAIFISVNAVNYFFDKIAPSSWPRTIHTIAIGHATACALENHRIRMDNLPQTSDSEHLIQLNTLQHIEGQTLLLVKGEGGRSTIANTLTARGARLISVAVYRRTLPNTEQRLFQQQWQDAKADIILFTSQQSMQNIFELLTSDARTRLCQTPCLVISHRLAATAYSLGIKKIIVSNYDNILETLEIYSRERIHNNIAFWHPNEGQSHDAEQ